MNLIETICNTIERHGLIPHGSRVVAGVSGGADSVALLHVLLRGGYPVEIAHLNHQLRGEESDQDEAFVRRLAQDLDVPITVKSADVASMAAAGGISLEMAARQARHAFFSEFNPSTIALAHHADDQVETFILKLARGAGSAGLGGMSYAQQLGHIRLIRPMLDVPRCDIIAWLTESGISWREDASNCDERFLRNRVRHTVLPLLERELNPNIRQTLFRTMDILREEDEWMMESVKHLGPGDATDRPRAAQRRIIRNWLFENDVEDLDFDTVESILVLMDKRNGTSIYELNDRQRVVNEYGTLRFEDDATHRAAPTWSLSIEAGHGWKRDPGNGIGMLPAEASFNAVKVGDSPITLRTYEPGDRFEPLGMEGSRKLQDIFTDQKIPQAMRSRIPIVVCRNEIIWLPGYRIARGWEVPGTQGASVHVRIEQNPAN